MVNKAPIPRTIHHSRVPIKLMRSGCWVSIPRRHSCFDDGSAGVEPSIASLVTTQLGPDVFDRVQLQAVWRQVQKRDFVRHAQLVPCLVPAGAFDAQQCVRTGGNAGADLGQVQVHHGRVRERQHQDGAGAAGRADGAEQVSPGVALIPKCREPRAAFSPYTRQRALLTDPRFVLPPKLERLAAGVLWQRRAHQGGEVAFACAAALWLGRVAMRRRPSRCSTVLMLRSATTTPSLAWIVRARSALRQRTTPCSAKSGLR